MVQHAGTTDDDASAVPASVPRLIRFASPCIPAQNPGINGSAAPELPEQALPRLIFTYGNVPLIYLAKARRNLQAVLYRRQTKPITT